MTIETELRDAYVRDACQGESKRITFPRWVKAMAANDRAILQDTAKAYLRLNGNHRQSFHRRMKETARLCADDVVFHAMKLYDSMTDNEREQLDSNAAPSRLPKAVLVALVANGLIDREWNAEAIRRDVRRLRKIATRYA